ncbi:membrane associated histidine-rich protein 1a, putative [Plasmodium vinckei brucechwatti]|uniref:Membrane associated histidine-rich protein 1a, putative n=1 Tax=Plasmodium vinckei brucechwatti TaxID=119398 RepID=A0A6V7SDG9_PLAVN|nr:membrane associated histidine-rich protein 1a, putative [Plasmodium vinckei brucechwatti]
MAILKEDNDENKVAQLQDEESSELSNYIAKESNETFSYLKKAENYMKNFYQSYLVPNESYDDSYENSDDENGEDQKNEGDEDKESKKKEKRKRKKKPKTFFENVKYNLTRKLTPINILFICFFIISLMWAYTNIVRNPNRIGYATGFIADAGHERAARPPGCTCGRHKAHGGGGNAAMHAK